MKNPRVAEALDWLEKHSKKSIREGMARYAIPGDKALAKKLASSEEPAPRWIGKDAFRELATAAVRKRMRVAR